MFERSVFNEDHPAGKDRLKVPGRDHARNHGPFGHRGREIIRLPDFIRNYAATTPDRRALHFERRDFTWAQFNDRCHRMAQALVNLGVKPGGRVAFRGQNSH